MSSYIAYMDPMRTSCKKTRGNEITYKLMITQNSTVGAEPANVYLQQGRICCVHLKLDHILPT